MMIAKAGSLNRKADFSIVFVILALLVFGVVMVYDASVVYAHEVFGGKYHFLILQITWALAGLFLLYLVSLFDYHLWTGLAKILFWVCLFLLFLLAWPRLPFFRALYPRIFYERIKFFPLVYGAYRWVVLNPHPLPELPLFGRLSFQPTELTKLALVLSFSSLLAARKKKFLRRRIPWHRNLLLSSFLPPLGIAAFLTVLQPDLGTAVVLVSIAIGIYFVSGAPLRHIFLILALFSIFSSFFVFSSPYRRQRLLTFLNPSSSGVLSSGYHIQQVLIALGSGGLTGLGFGQSRQKYEYLPEVTTDSIFAVVGEEMGFLGASLLICLFSLLLYFGFKVSCRAKDEWGKLIAFGITFWVGAQVAINLAAMTKVLPLTGVPLPLVSYGGSSLVLTLSALGILLNISRQAVKRR